MKLDNFLMDISIGIIIIGLCLINFDYFIIGNVVLFLSIGLFVFSFFYLNPHLRLLEFRKKQKSTLHFDQSFSHIHSTVIGDKK
jgi:hypothetical protein